LGFWEQYVTERAVHKPFDLAGRKSEMAYQLAKASAEIKRDIETIITANQGQTAGSVWFVSSQDGFFVAYIKTNANEELWHNGRC